MEPGKRIWVESLLTDEEYAETAAKYPKLFPKGNKKIPEFECDFKWRKGMGAGLTPDEITLINLRLDEALKKAGL